MRDFGEVQLVMDELRHNDSGVMRALLGTPEDPLGYIIPLRFLRSVADVMEPGHPRMCETSVLGDTISIDEYLLWAAKTLPFDVTVKVFGDSHSGLVFVMPVVFARSDWYLVILKSELRDEFIAQMKQKFLMSSAWRRQNNWDLEDSGLPDRASALARFSCRREVHRLLRSTRVIERDEVVADYSRCYCGSNEKLDVVRK